MRGRRARNYQRGVLLRAVQWVPILRLAHHVLTHNLEILVDTACSAAHVLHLVVAWFVLGFGRRYGDVGGGGAVGGEAVGSAHPTPLIRSTSHIIIILPFQSPLSPRRLLRQRPQSAPLRKLPLHRYSRLSQSRRHQGLVATSPILV